MPTVPQRYRQTDGRLTIAIPRFALRAWRGKNIATAEKLTFGCTVYLAKHEHFKQTDSSDVYTTLSFSVSTASTDINKGQNNLAIGGTAGN